MTTPDVDTLQQRFAEYPTELLSLARSLASANGDGPDPGLLADAGDLVKEIVRDADRLDQLEREPVAAKRRVPIRQAAELVIDDPAGVMQRLERLLAPTFDPETGLQRTRLEVLNALSGEVEFAVEPQQFDNGDWLFQLVGKRAPKVGVVVKVRISERQAASPRDLEDRIAFARCGNLPKFTRGKDEWRAFRDALIEASEVVELGGSEAGAWHRRIVAYLESNLARLDPSSAEEREQLIERPRPFAHPDGSTWLHVPSFYEALAVRKVDVRSGQIEGVLGDLGWTPQSIKARINGQQRRRRFWRSPDHFDPGSDL